MKENTKQGKDIKYKAKSIKMHDDTWELFKEERRKSGLSWNTYILKLHGKDKPYAKPLTDKLKLK